MPAMNDSGGGEGTPLLRSSSSELSSADNASTKAYTRIPICVIVLLLGLFAMTLGESFQEPAFGEIEEGIFCREYYTNVTDSSNDPRCKDERIQSDISMLEAVATSIRYTASLLTAIPYGIVAERFGRRRVLTLSMLGMALRFPLDLIVFKIFPIRFYWAVELTTVIGGGLTVFIAMIYTIISDMTSEAQRSNVFYYISAILVGTPILGNPLAYLAMKRGPWFSAYIAIACSFIAFASSLYIPETKNIMNPQNRSIDNDNTITENLPTQNIARSFTLSKSKVLSSVKDGIISLRIIIWDDKKLSIVLFSILFTRLGSYTNALLMQYIAKRYSMRWSEANLVITIKFLTKLILVLFILPFISQVLLRARVSPLAKDLLLARCCIVVTVIGTFGIALAATPAVLFAFLPLFAFLEGFNASVKSLLAQLAGSDRTAILFTAVGVLENVGILLAGPAIAGTFSVGLRWGEQWYGLAFMVAGLMFSVAAMIVLIIRISHQDKVEQNCDEAGNGN